MGGAGGSGGGGPTNILLTLAAPSGIAGQFDPNSGFSAKNLNLNIHESSLVPYAGGAIAAVRRNSMVPAENNELFRAAYMPASGFSMPQQVGAFGFAADGPALASFGFGALLFTFLGTDNQHYFTQYNGMSFDAFAPVPGGLPGTQAFGPMATALAQSPIKGIYAVYAGDNEALYYVFKNDPGSTFTFSSGIPSSPVVNTIVPAAIVDQNDDLLVFYVRKSDGRICMVKLITPQNAFSAEEELHPNAITAGSPSVTKTSAGDYLIAWHGFNNNGIYFLRGSEGMWGAPVTVIQPNAQTSLPAVQSGLSGAEADIVFGLDTTIQLARIGSANSISILQGPDTLVPVTHVSTTLISP